ncbi:MAG: alcohol dehydrogenase catalytic domain-containing protein [Nocardioides sp.]
MRAAVYDRFGGADVLSVREINDPPVGPDTVLVRARATSVNPVDWKVREGYLQGAYPHHLPIVPGWDAAGVVEAVGPAVRTGLEVGDEVFGYVRRDDIALGTTAELVAAPERTVARKPAGLSFRRPPRCRWSA